MASVVREPMLGYHSDSIESLTGGRDPVTGQWQSGSLTGAVASKRVTEARKGYLSADRNRAKECKGRRKLN